MKVDRHKIQRFSYSGQPDDEGEFVRFKDVFNPDYSFKDDDEYNIECCPFCGCENDAHNDGTTTCEHCGAPNLVPCNACKEANFPDEDYCDWSEENGCTPFPTKGFKLSPDAIQVIIECLNGEYEAYGNLLDKEHNNVEYLRRRKEIENMIDVLSWNYKEEK